MSDPLETIAITRAELEVFDQGAKAAADYQRICRNQSNTILSQGEIIRQQNERIAELKKAAARDSNNDTDYRAEIHELSRKCFSLVAELNALKQKAGMVKPINLRHDDVAAVVPPVDLGPWAGERN